MPTPTTTTAALPSPVAPPERPSPPRSSRHSPPPNDMRLPAERVRVTDNPASGRGRAYLIERELEQDGNAALQRFQ